MEICCDKVVSQNLLVNGQTSSEWNLADVISEEIIKEIIIQLNIDKSKVSRIVKGQNLFNCKNLDEHLLFATHLINEMVVFVQSVNVNITQLNSFELNSTHHNDR